MKKAYRIIAASVAACVAFVSCNKEAVTDLDDGIPSSSDNRLITASFGGVTKSVLGTDGLTPMFSAGDKIMVSNGTSKQECIVELEDETAVFTTKLTGDLTAVYPSTAALLEGNEITGVLVPTVQDGTFASANIAMAEISDGDETATFENRTAVFRITPGAGADTKYVDVITAGLDIANSASTGYDSLHKIHVASASADAVYVSVLVPASGLTIGDLSFADGIHIKTLKGSTTSIVANTIYTVTGSGWDMEYVDIPMTVNSVTRTYKWAKMNLGAQSPEDPGDYFMWGELVGHKPNGTGWGAFIDDFSSFNHEDPRYPADDQWNASICFDWNNALFTSGVYSDSDKAVFTKYVSESCAESFGKNGFFDDKAVLDLCDDAVNVVMGGSWRMPTGAEMEGIAQMSPETKVWDDVKKGYIIGVAPDTIFLPGNGYGAGTMCGDVGGEGNYWSSSVKSNFPKNAEALYFGSNFCYHMDTFRRTGMAIRPISE